MPPPIVLTAIEQKLVDQYGPASIAWSHVAQTLNISLHEMLLLALFKGLPDSTAFSKDGPGQLARGY